MAGNAITFLKGILETDTAGETTAQVGTTGAEQTTGTVGDSTPAEPAEPAVKTDTEAEIKAFKSFVSKRKSAGKWRDFVFETVDADVAKTLNDQARSDVLKKKSIQAGRRVTYQVQTD